MLLAVLAGAAAAGTGEELLVKFLALLCNNRDGGLYGLLCQH